MSSYAYSQKDKSLQSLFSGGYTLDRNQVEFNQPKDLIFSGDSLKKHDVFLGCLLAKEAKSFPNSYCKTFMSKDGNFLVLHPFRAYIANAMIRFMQTLIYQT